MLSHCRLVDPVLIYLDLQTFENFYGKKKSWEMHFDFSPPLVWFQVSGELRGGTIDTGRKAKTLQESVSKLTWLMCFSLSIIWLMTGSGGLLPFDSVPGCNLFRPGPGNLTRPDGNIESVFKGISLHFDSSLRPSAHGPTQPGVYRHLASTEGRAPLLRVRSQVFNCLIIY